jgi:hypothetical protein
MAYKDKADKRAAQIRYRQTPEGKACQVRYRLSAKNKASQARYRPRCRLRYPDRIAAHKAIGYAIRTGRLIRLPCEVCHKEPAESHHYKGYAKEHQLDVQFLCPKHHREVERKSKWKKQ